MKVTQKELNDDQILIISEDETTRIEDTRKKENFELLKTVIFNNNEMVLIENYKNGKLHGKYEQYFENGSLQISGEYREGKPVGKFYEFKENGSLSRIVKVEKDGTIKTEFESLPSIKTLKKFLKDNK
ncbi:toxin-antitoxin system YwqK family antitoxin [Fusobacterium sp. SYSU M8A802]